MGGNRPGRAVSLVAFAGAMFVVMTAAGAAAADPPLAGNQAAPSGLGRTPSSVGLRDSHLRTAVERLEAGLSAGPDVIVIGDTVLVEVAYAGERAQVEDLVTNLGGELTGYAGGVVLEARVPFWQLVALEHMPEVLLLRLPLEANEPVAARGGATSTALATDGEEVAKTNATAWHAAGFTGAGVKVGIVDYFDATMWNAAQAAGEVPAPAGTFCRENGAACDIWAGGSAHGEGVAEIVHEMAPAAQIYVASALTAADLQAAVDYFAGQGVTILSRSLTAEYDGPGDGTGPIASVINSAVAQGITWFNSAGNNGGGGGSPGSYWRGSWVDNDADGVLNFSASDELMGLGCFFVNGFRWNDWGPSRTDYDIYVFDDPGATVLKAFSEGDQTAGAPPLEHVALNCGSNDVDYLAVALFSAGGGTAGDVLEFMVNGSGLEYWQNPFSASGPASDTASPGGLSIGAVDPPLGVTIADYSAQGPTNDNRIKPDVSAAACVMSFTYAPDCFNGTSAATPVAAGAAALLLDAGLASTPAQLKTYLLANAVVERGPPGADNVYGWGEVVLPTPPTPPTNNAVADFDGNGTTDVSVYRPATGRWYVRNQFGINFGLPTDLPVPCDYDGSGSTDIAVYRPATGRWYIRNQTAVNFGVATDVPIPGDYDGSGTCDIGVYRPATGRWYIRNQTAVNFGVATDVPIPGDYDGNGTTDIAVYRPATGRWYVRNQFGISFGLPTDVPQPGDYDGNGTTDIAVYRPSNGRWYIRDQTNVGFGLPTDIPLPLARAIYERYY